MRHAFLFLLILLCILFILFKIQHLSLPFFWDEAWPYSTGVYYMYTHGLSLLPGSIPFDISRGHPLLFHFLAASWMKVFGSSVTVVHAFPLLVSVLLIVCMYLFCIDFFSKAVAIGACLLVMVQPVFFSQSAMLLPEVLVALFTLLSLWAFLRGWKLLYVLYAALLLLTKESGVIIVVALFCWSIFEKIFQRKESILQIIKKSLYLLFPVVIASVFFILQKNQTGHFFLPMYVGGNNLEWTVFAEKLKNYFAYVFIYQGRNALSVFLILASVFLVFKRVTFSPEEKRILFPIIIFIALYFLFSSSSFYSPRYMLSILPLVVIISTYLVFKAASKKPVIYLGFLFVTAFVSVFFCLRKKPVNDHGSGFTDGISVTKSAVNYCEEKGLNDKKIYSNFLMRSHLTHQEHGYISGNIKFNGVANNFDDNVDVCIFSSYELDDVYNVLKQQNSFRLAKRFEKNYAWCEVYERIN